MKEKLGLKQCKLVFVHSLLKIDIDYFFSFFENKLVLIGYCC